MGYLNVVDNLINADAVLEILDPNNKIFKLDDKYKDIINKAIKNNVLAMTGLPGVDMSEDLSFEGEVLMGNLPESYFKASRLYSGGNTILPFIMGEGFYRYYNTSLKNGTSYVDYCTMNNFDTTGPVPNSFLSILKKSDAEKVVVEINALKPVTNLLSMSSSFFKISNDKEWNPADLPSITQADALNYYGGNTISFRSLSYNDVQSFKIYNDDLSTGTRPLLPYNTIWLKCWKPFNIVTDLVTNHVIETRRYPILVDISSLFFTFYSKNTRGVNVRSGFGYYSGNTTQNPTVLNYPNYTTYTKIHSLEYELFNSGLISKPPFFYGNQFRTVCWTTKEEQDNLFQFFGADTTWNDTEATTKPIDEWDIGSVFIHPIPSGNNPGSGGQTGGQPAGGEGFGDYETLEDDVVEMGTEYTGSSELQNTYALTLSEVEQLQKMFIDGQIWSNISGFFKDPQTSIINLTWYPINFLELDTKTTYKNPITIAGLEMSTLDNVVSGYKLESQYKTVFEVGRYNFREFFGSFLDFEPYTGISLFLPYHGFVQIEASVVMGKTLKIDYALSTNDGSALAILSVSNTSGEFHVIKTVNFNLGYQIAVTKSDAGDINQNKIKAGIGAGVGALALLAIPATGGASAPLAGGLAGAGGLTGAAAVGLGVNTINSFTAKEKSYSGVTEGQLSRCLPQKPYVIITRPRTNMPPDYKSIYGYQTNLNVFLKELSGFTKTEHTKLSGLTATETEQEEIKNILETGVIL